MRRRHGEAALAEGDDAAPVALGAHLELRARRGERGYVPNVVGDQVLGDLMKAAPIDQDVERSTRQRPGAQIDGNELDRVGKAGGVSEECMADNLHTKTPGTLTVGTDNPAFPPYFLPNDAGNTEPWDPSQGDPTTGEGQRGSTRLSISKCIGSV